jgi:CheY-like chemotaxis protein
MPQGGKLTIETPDVNLSDAYVGTHATVTPGHYVMLAMSDTGCGIEPELRPHIFEPFFTTKEQGKGTGLGLATVYGIVKQSGGCIWAYSELGHGATFKVYLPGVEDAVDQVQPTPSVPKKALQGHETVLLVEDEQSVRSLVYEVLRSKGYKVLEVSRPEGALKISRQYKGFIQLLLTDVVLLKMSGREVAKRIVPRRPRMKVLYMSGYTDNAIVHHGVLNPGAPFLQKPFTPEVLAQKVREVLDQ